MNKDKFILWLKQQSEYYRKEQKTTADLEMYISALECRRDAEFCEFLIRLVGNGEFDE